MRLHSRYSTSRFYCSNKLPRTYRTECSGWIENPIVIYKWNVNVILYTNEFKWNKRYVSNQIKITVTFPYRSFRAKNGVSELLKATQAYAISAIKKIRSTKSLFHSPNYCYLIELTFKPTKTKISTKKLYSHNYRTYNRKSTAIMLYEVEIVVKQTKRNKKWIIYFNYTFTMLLFMCVSVPRKRENRNRNYLRKSQISIIFLNNGLQFLQIEWNYFCC